MVSTDFIPLPSAQRSDKCPADQSAEIWKKSRADPFALNTVSSLASASELAVVACSITLMPALKDRQLTNADTAMRSVEVAAAIVRSSILLVDAVHLAEQSDIAIFSQALHFSLVGLLSMYEAMVHHNRLIRAVDKMNMSSDRQAERIKELELRAAEAEGIMEEAEKKLPSMDLTLKSLEQEIDSLKAENDQLSNALATSEDSLVCTIKAAKDKGFNEATAVNEVQFAKLENMLFEDNWTSALEAVNVSADSDLRKNVPYPHLETVEHATERAGVGHTGEE